MADQVVRMPESSAKPIGPLAYNSSKNSAGNDGKIQRKCAECEEEDEELQMKSAGPNPRAASASVIARIQNSKGGGKPMDSSTSHFMSSRMGRDMSHVRIHTGNQAAQMNQEINARAFTVGKDIYFNRGQYSPGTHEGKRLLAHELTHTLQQRPEIRRQPPNSYGPPPIDYDLISDPMERKLRMETDFKVFTWQDALKRLEKGELTDEDLKNDRLVNRMTGLKSAEVDDLIRKIEAFKKKKDKERAEASEEDRKKIKKIETGKIVEWLKVRKEISTPLQENATVSYDVLGQVQDYKIKLKDVDISVLPDTRNTQGNATQPRTNFEGSFKWVVRGGKITDLTKNDVPFNPTSLEVEITTTYKNNPDETSAYGKGTTADDKAEKTTTLRVHEGQHGTDFIDYLKKTPLPVNLSGGVNGKLTPKEFKKILEYIKGITKDTCELTDQSGLSQDEYLKTDEGKASGIKSCRTP